MGDSTGSRWGDMWEVVHTIHFGSYNIRNGPNGGLESALRRMYQANTDLSVFQDTKFTGGGLHKRFGRVQGHGN